MAKSIFFWLPRVHAFGCLYKKTILEKRQMKSPKRQVHHGRVGCGYNLGTFGDN